MTIKKACFLLTVAGGLALGQPTGCPVLKAGSDAELIAYLRSSRTSLTPVCVVELIYRVGARKNPLAADALVPYLDFVGRPNSGAIRLRIDWMEEYPAAQAIYSIGESAVASLSAAISRGDTSDTVRTNAVRVLAAIYREDVSRAVRLLSRESRRTNDAAASARLFGAARYLTQSVKDQSLRAQCELALSQ